MNEMTGTQEMIKQGWMMRLLTAVGERLFEWICLCEWGMSPYETRMFMIHNGFGGGFSRDETIMAESLMGAKQGDNQGALNAG